MQTKYEELKKITSQCLSGSEDSERESLQNLLDNLDREQIPALFYTVTKDYDLNVRRMSDNTINSTTMTHKNI